MSILDISGARFLTLIERVGKKDRKNTLPLSLLSWNMQLWVNKTTIGPVVKNESIVKNDIQKNDHIN